MGKMNLTGTDVGGAPVAPCAVAEADAYIARLLEVCTMIDSEAKRASQGVAARDDLSMRRASLEQELGRVRAGRRYPETR